VSCLLRAESITKSFAGVRALRAVSFDLHAGEIHALVGENGAGKSTLIKIITGAERADSGALTVCGREVPHMDPATARSLGITAIYQQPALFPDLSVAENIALSLEERSAWRLVDWKGRRRLAAELLDRIGTPLDPDRLVTTLTMPEQQIVEIAKAIGGDARIVIMDEPTASLSEREVTHLFGIIARLRETGVGIIYISHRMEEIFAIASRVTVLRDGQTVETCSTSTVTRQGLINLMVGRELGDMFPRTPVTPGEVVLDVRGVSSRAAGVRDITFSVRAGEILGIAGLVGSGRTQMAETIFGITPPHEGEIVVRGARVRVGSPADAIQAGIAYLPEDRCRHGVVLEMSVAANTSMASLPAVSRAGLIDASTERCLAQQYIEQFAIKAPSPHTEVGSLSGGNQQKVALARWLATRPSVLILDEPTQGVDVGSKAAIHALMQRLTEQGLAIVMISSELPEILGMSDRIAVMRGGTIRGMLSRGDASQAAILGMALES
jgi:rhamnose transport system ATP-binding protein